MSEITFGLKCVETSNGSFGSKIRYGPYSGYSYASLIHSVSFSKNYWSEWINDPLLCQRGWHCVLRDQVIRRKEIWRTRAKAYANITEPITFLTPGNEIWVVAVRGNKEIDDRKAAYSQMRFIRVITHGLNTFDYHHPKWWSHPEILQERFDKIVTDIWANPKKYGFEDDDKFA